MMSGKDLGGGKEILNIDDEERWRTKSSAEKEREKKTKKRETGFLDDVGG